MRVCWCVCSVCVCVCVCLCVCGLCVCVFVFVCLCVASVIQRARRMRRVTLSSVACLIAPYFPILSHKLHDFLKKKVIEVKMCVLVFSTNFVSKISHCKYNLERVSDKCI
jgi:hypothetical protein